MTIMLKPLKHNKINLKGKMILASFEELESEDIAISTDGDRIYDLVRDGNFMYTLINLTIFILNIFYLNVKYISIYVCVCVYIYKLFDLIKMNLTNSMFLFMCRRCICCCCTHRQQWKCHILFDAMHREKDEIIGGL